MILLVATNACAQESLELDLWLKSYEGLKLTDLNINKPK
jgi:hypothetical protein